MSYLSTVTGRVTVAPPIPVRVVRLSAYLAAGSDVRYEVESTSEEMDEGTLIRDHIVAIVCSFTEAFKAYHLEQHLTDAVAEIRAHGYECSGALVREGEEQGDVERYRVANGQVVTEKAELRWPDGTAVDL